MNISAQVTPPPLLPQLLYQWRNSTWYLSARRLGVPRPDPNVVEKEKCLVLPGMQPQLPSLLLYLPSYSSS